MNTYESQWVTSLIHALQLGFPEVSFVGDKEVDTPLTALWVEPKPHRFSQEKSSMGLEITLQLPIEDSFHSLWISQLQTCLERFQMSPSSLGDGKKEKTKRDEKKMEVIPPSFKCHLLPIKQEKKTDKKRTLVRFYYQALIHFYL